MVEEVVGDWSQQDLNSDNVMLLDAWSALYIWIGKHLLKKFSKNIRKSCSCK